MCAMVEMLAARLELLALRSGRCGQGAFFGQSQKKSSTQVSVPQKFHKGISHIIYR